MLKKSGWVLLFLSLPAQMLMLSWLARKPGWVEGVYFNRIYQPLSLALRWLFGWIPFPIGQFIFYGVIGWLSWALFKLVWLRWRKKVGWKTFLKRLLSGTLAFLSTFFFLFNLLWGLNYYRRPVHEITGIKQEMLSLPELKKLCVRLIQLTHESRGRITGNQDQPLVLPMDKKEMVDQALLGYHVLARLYPDLRYRQPSVKAVLVPELMSFFGIGGIYFPFSGEANVNMDPPNVILPETICHEMAHQIGIASEDEANYVAYLTCQHHPDPAFQYSGNLMAMKYAMNRLYGVDSLSFNQLKSTFQPGLVQDLEANRRYWESFDNPIEIVGRLVHDLFLKANDQEEGVKSYSRVVELVMGEYRRNGLNFVREPGNKNKLRPDPGE